MLANVAYLNVLPLHGDADGADGARARNPVRDAGPRRHRGGRDDLRVERRATIMAIAILISTFGCNNGLILAGARVYYAMARDGLFFRRVGTLNAQSRSRCAV